MRALLQKIIDDWPQAFKDEDMNGGDAVDAILGYITEAKELLRYGA